jgi:hypothetical protein
VCFGVETKCVFWSGDKVCVLEWRQSVCFGVETNCVFWSGDKVCVLECSHSVCFGVETKCVFWSGDKVCVLDAGIDFYNCYLDVLRAKMSKYTEN